MARLYEDLASWWPLVSAPEDYADEAATYARILEEAGDAPCATLLELGSGGGNNASHLKRRFAATLVEPSEAMLSLSRALNPECEHVRGDMRTVRLQRAFDRVFVHDAVCYMTSRADLRRAVETAFVHCRPGGAALFCPDHVRERFAPSTEHGGHDGDGASARYLEWSWDPDPADDTYVVDYAFVLREGDRVRVEHDRHVEGLFARAVWMEVLGEVGFEARSVTELPSVAEQLFVGVKR
jgi:SAM-dependent methyltransferase